MKENKENVKNLLKNKFFYLGIFGFIFLIIIIMTFSGGKKPDESECATGKIKDAEGACDVYGDNKTSICRENCEANVGSAEKKWDCKTKKCICKDGWIKCGTSGLCCKSEDCINSICCPKENQTEGGLCCGGGTTPSSDKKNCESLCGPIGTTNICEGKDTCYRIVNATKLDIDSLKDHKYIDKDDRDLYFCANNYNSYGNSTYYPNSISTYNFCMDLKDNGISSGFCYPNNDNDDQNIKDAYEKNISECTNTNTWYSFLDTNKNTNETYKKYIKAVTLREDLPGDFAGKYCGPLGSGSIVADITPQSAGGGVVTDCILKSATPNTKYVSYNGDNSKCLSLQACSKTSNIKNNFSLENNVRKIEIQDSCDNEGCKFSEYITETTEPLKLQNIPEYKFGECTNNATSECNALGLDANFICYDKYVTKTKTQKLYYCDKTDSNAYKCVETEHGVDLSTCASICKTPPANALLYNKIYDKIYIKTARYGGDMFYTGSGSRTVMAGTREPCEDHCMNVTFETCPDEALYNDKIHVTRGEYFFIKMNNDNGIYITRKWQMHDNLGQLSYGAVTDAIKFQIPDNGESEKIVIFGELFMMYAKDSLYPVKSLEAISDFNYACGKTASNGGKCYMNYPIRFTIDRNSPWIPTEFRVTNTN